jgi:hypothetical protein
MRTILVLSRDQMGHGDAALGQKILGTFLRKAIALGNLTAIVLFNSGVRLVASDSPVLTELTQLHEEGVDLRPCGTCLDFYQLQPAVGHVSNMDEIIAELARAEKVITL